MTDPNEKALIKKQDLDDVAKVLGTKEGRRMIWKQLESAKIFHSCYTGNSATFYNEGRRDLGLELFNKVMHFEALYLKMRKENANEKEND